MTDPREAEAIERMATAVWGATEPDEPFPWQLNMMTTALTELLSPSSAPCPTCGGTGKVYRPPLLRVPPVKQYIVPCRDCADGTVAVPPLLKWSTEP